MNYQEDVSKTLASSLAGEIVRTFGMVRLRASGTSMVPSILPGDLISIQRAGLREISPGEVVVFIQNGRLLVHRVVSSGSSFDTPWLITRGDRLCHNDPPVFSSELLGRVVSVERGNQQVKSIAAPRGWQRVMARLLRTSDRATYLYLRLAACWRTLFSRRAECQV
jgi:signal peptidase I